MALFNNSLNLISINQEIKQFLRLAIPLASAQLAQSLTGFFDTLMMGRLGAETLAAGGIAAFSFSALIFAAGGLIMPITPAISQAFGANDKKRVENVARQGLWLVLFPTIILMGIISHLDSWMAAYGQAENTVKLAKVYLEIMMWGLFPALGFIWLRGVVAGLSQTRPIIYIVIAGTGINIFANYALAFGKWGFPRWELAGLALSTVLTHWGMFLALMIYILHHQHLRKYQIFSRLHSFRLNLFWKLVKVGLPLTVLLGLEIGMFTVVTYLMGALGTNVLAAHQIVLQTVVVIFMIPLGISFAATIRVGEWRGKNNWEGVQRSGYLSIVIGFVFMIFMAIILLLFPELIVGVYLDLDNPANQEIIDLVSPMLTVAALSQIGDGVQKIANGVLQGLQDTRVPLLLGIPAFWIIGLPLGFWLGFHTGWGAAGLWFGQSVGVAIAGIIFTIRFYYLTTVWLKKLPSVS